MYALLVASVSSRPTDICTYNVRVHSAADPQCLLDTVDLQRNVRVHSAADPQCLLGTVDLKRKYAYMSASVSSRPVDLTAEPNKYASGSAVRSTCLDLTAEPDKNASGSAVRSRPAWI